MSLVMQCTYSTYPHSKFNQYYNFCRFWASVGRAAYMTCLTRLDGNKEDIFTRKIKQTFNAKQRRNYNSLMNFENGVLYCKNGRNYTAIELCNGNSKTNVESRSPPGDPANTCVMKNDDEVVLSPNT